MKPDKGTPVLSVAILSLVLAASGFGARRAVAQEGTGSRTRPPQRLSGDSRPAPPTAAGLDTGAITSETAQIAGLKVTIWRPAPVMKSPAPLVIFSHGFGGSSTQSKFLMRALAEAGYLVIAPNHKDAHEMGSGTPMVLPEKDFGNAVAWNDRTYKDRADDITSLIHTLKSDPSWAKAVDWDKVALAGHSLGGYTVLGLAGAWPSWRIKEVPIKAVLALSPFSAPYVIKKTLDGVKSPVMYQGGTRDMWVTPFVSKPGGAFDQTPSPAMFVEFDRAGHFAWTDLTSQYQTEISAYSVAFLDRYVRGKMDTDFLQKNADVTTLRSK